MTQVDHARVRQLLPWYTSGTLSEPERAQVDAHVDGCEQCAQELDRLRDLGEILQRQDSEGWEPSEERFEQIVSRLESRPESRAAPRSSEPSRWAGVSRARRLAIAGLVVAGLALLLLVRTSYSPEMVGALPASETAPAADAARIQVVFVEGMSELALDEVLFAANAVIESGPSRRGAYRLALRDPERLAAVLETLRADPRVRLAEPLDDSD